MNCRRCKKDLPDGALWCCWCGAKQTVERRTRRANGEGSVYKRGTKWCARYRKMAGDIMIDKFKGGFPTKIAALEWLAHAADLPRTAPDVTFGDLYSQWEKRHTERVSASTMACYKSAYKYLEPLAPYRFALLTTEQLQQYVDACPHGIRTRENMKALCTLLYRYAREIGVTDNDYGQFIYIDRKSAPPPEAKRSFTRSELGVLANAAGVVPYIDIVLIMCYTGFRINEICAMNREAYDPELRTLTGGSKTAAGMHRVVPIAPVIHPHVERYYRRALPGDALFIVGGKRLTTNHLRDLQAAALAQLPCVRDLKPHECRHTFASLMKSAHGAKEDKKRLIGHASDEMLEHYTHAEIDELRAIISQL